MAFLSLTDRTDAEALQKDGAMWDISARLLVEVHGCRMCQRAFRSLLNPNLIIQVTYKIACPESWGEPEGLIDNHDKKLSMTCSCIVLNQYSLLSQYVK